MTGSTSLFERKKKELDLMISSRGNGKQFEVASIKRKLAGYCFNHHIPKIFKVIIVSRHWLKCKITDVSVAYCNLLQLNANVNGVLGDIMNKNGK